jgi:hypothetical protein
MSMFTITGKVLNVYEREVKDDAGKIEVKHKVQLLGDLPVPGGSSRFDLVDLTIEESANFRQFMGKTIQVPLGFFAPGKGQIVYYIPKGSVAAVVPEVRHASAS